MKVKVVYQAGISAGIDNVGVSGLLLRRLFNGLAPHFCVLHLALATRHRCFSMAVTIAPPARAVAL